MKSEHRENLLNSLEKVSILGSVVMAFVVFAIVMKFSGFDPVHSAAVAFIASTLILVLRLKIN